MQVRGLEEYGRITNVMFGRCYIYRLGWKTKIPLNFVILMVIVTGSSALSTTCSAQTNPCEAPLIRAIRSRNLREARKLMKAGVNLNEKVCAEGNTALFEAIGSQPEIAKELILAGADVNEADHKRGTPLMAAAFYCLEDIALLLLKKGANINASDADGYTPLMQAADECGDGRMVALLIRAGASVNAKTKNGKTPLIVAAFFGNETAVMELVAAGADLRAETQQGETALSIAEGRKVGRRPSHDKICAFLQSVLGAEPTPTAGGRPLTH